MIGSPVWIYNENIRVYREGRPAPSWRGHWEQRWVVGETRVSWIVSSSKRDLDVPAEEILGRRWLTRIPKKPKPGSAGVAWSEEEIEDLLWARWACPPVERAIRRLGPAGLREVIEVLKRHGVEVRVPEVRDE